MYIKITKHNAKQHWFGRLGNNLRTLRNAVQIALQLKLTKITFSTELKEHKHLNIDTIKFPDNDSAIKPCNDKHNNKLEKLVVLKTSDLFYMFSTGRDISKKFGLPNGSFQPLDNETSRQQCLKYLTHVIKTPLQTPDFDPDTTLVIHIRSGDINTKNRRKRTQPPISMYDKIISDTEPKFQTVLVVTEPSKLNPCIAALKTKYNAIIQTKSVNYDFQTLLMAKHLVLSNDSWFAQEALFFSKHPKTFYRMVFKKRFDFTFMEHKEQIYLIKDYIGRYNWEYTEKNMALMINHPVSSVSVFNNLSNNLA